MRLRSLESRVVALFIALILLVQVAAFAIIRKAIDDNARESIRKALVIDEKIFARLLDQNTQRLLQGGSLLAADYGFRAAISDNDSETIATALANHGARIHASLSAFIDVDKKIKAASSPELAKNLTQSIQKLVQQAQQNGNATSRAIVNERLYQLVVLPVLAPDIKGWVVMAFPIDINLINDMHELSSLHVSIFTHDKDKWIAGPSNLTEQDNRALLDLLPAQVKQDLNISSVLIGNDEYSARLINLSEDTQQSAIAVLQLSVSQAVAPYKQLQLTLLILTAIGIVIAIIGSVFTAKRITNPLRELAETAKRLGEGNYLTDIKVRGDDEIGNLARAFINMRDDISQREQEIRRLAYWDTLTNLPNRALFVSMLNDTIRNSEQHHLSCHVLMMDLDRFKHVNDVMGHAFGDMLLTQVAHRISTVLGPGLSKPARLGGDEFAILLPNSTLAGAVAVAEKILLSLEKPISLDEQTVDLGAGIGIAGFPEHGNDAQALLSRAEVAMYAAKRANSGAIAYTPEIDKSSQQSLSLLSELRNALDTHAFRMYVQPKIDLSSNSVVGVEALVRWQHPERGFIFPDQFIPFAEQTGFIRLLTHWVLEQAAEKFHQWQAQGLRVKMSVNLSTRDLLDQDLPVKFAAILDRYQVMPSSFCLEITESAIMDDPVRAQQTLEKLHSMGVDLSIDDFGTGYSSLAYLKSLPVDELKIDKSFVLKMEKDADDAKIVKSTIDLGHNMGLRVVAEGVENVEVMHLLHDMGCDQIQGYFISRPIPADQFPDWANQWVAPLSSEHAA